MSNVRPQFNCAIPPPPTDPKERMRIYLANRPNLPVEQVTRFAGQWVAIQWDGTAVVDGAPDLDTLLRKLHDNGFNSEHVGFQFVADSEDSETGGVGFNGMLHDERAKTA